MTDRPKDSSERQLFQGLDEQERTYAPQEVPGETMPPTEVDQGGTAGEAAPAGTSNDAGIAPVYPGLGTGMHGVIPPVVPEDDEQHKENSATPPSITDGEQNGGRGQLLQYGHIAPIRCCRAAVSTTSPAGVSVAFGSKSDE